MLWGGYEEDTLKIRWVQGVQGMDRAKKIIYYYYFSFSICMNVLLACIYVYYVYAWCMWRTKEGTRSLENGITGGCEPLWELGINFSVRATSAANHWAISLTPIVIICDSLYFFLCAYVCVWYVGHACEHVCVCMHVCGYMQGPDRMLGIVFCHSLSYSFEAGFLTKWEAYFVKPGWLISKLLGSVPQACPSFNVDAEDSDSVTCTGSSLTHWEVLLPFPPPQNSLL